MAMTLLSQTDIHYSALMAMTLLSPDI